MPKKKASAASKPAGKRVEVRLLKSLHLLSDVPESQLEKLAGFLEARSYKDGEAVCEEGQPGESMFFVASGSVRITKKLERAKPGSARKDLALLRPGDCFGEMALIASMPRSADAHAAGDSVLLRLGKDELKRWLDASPTGAVSFFTQLVHKLTGHLRRSSSELTLILNLSQALLEPFSSGKEVLEKVMAQLLPHLEGAWCAGAYLYNEFNDEMDLAAASADFAKFAGRFRPSDRPAANAWLDDSTYQVIFPGKKRLLGHMVFCRSLPLSSNEKDEVGRTLTTMSRLIASTLENVGYRVDEILRERLRASVQNSRL